METAISKREDEFCWQCCIVGTRIRHESVDWTLPGVAVSCYHLGKIGLDGYTIQQVMKMGSVGVQIIAVGNGTLTILRARFCADRVSNSRSLNHSDA